MLKLRQTFLPVSIALLSVFAAASARAQLNPRIAVMRVFGEPEAVTQAQQIQLERGLAEVLEDEAVRIMDPRLVISRLHGTRYAGCVRLECAGDVARELQAEYTVISKALVVRGRVQRVWVAIVDTRDRRFEIVLEVQAQDLLAARMREAMTDVLRQYASATAEEHAAPASASATASADATAPDNTAEAPTPEPTPTTESVSPSPPPRRVREVVGPLILGGAGLAVAGVSVAGFFVESCTERFPSGRCASVEKLNVAIPISGIVAGAGMIVSAVLWHFFSEHDEPMEAPRVRLDLGVDSIFIQGEF